MFQSRLNIKFLANKKILVNYENYKWAAISMYEYIYYSPLVKNNHLHANTLVTFI